MSAAPSARFAHIDAMRAVAVLLVVFAHAGIGNVVPGGSGVTIFFSISGFIITWLVLREREQIGRFRIGAFYLRRALKIGPPLVTIVFIPTALYAIAHTIDWHSVLAQAAFFYNWTIFNGPNHVLPGSRVVWSLAIEEQFYVVFALLWLFASRKAYGRRLLVGVALGAIVWCEVTKILYVLDSPTAHEVRIYYGSETRIDGIALGILTALAYNRWSHDPDWLPGLRRLAASPWAFVGAIALYVGTLAYRDEYFRSTARYPLQGVVACIVILYGFLGREDVVRTWFSRVVNLRAVQLVGLASYSIYLVHFTMVYVTLNLTRDWSKGPRVVFGSVAGVIAGILVYRVIEVPVARVRARLHEPGDPGRAMTAPSAVLDRP